MQKFILLLLISCIGTASFSQGTWRHGTVMLNDSSIISGEINDKEWLENPDIVEFRQVQGQVQLYSCTEIKRFSTDRPVKYESWIVSFDDDAQELGSLPLGRENRNSRIDTVFLRVVVEAPIGLLYLKGKGRLHLFLRKGGRVEELLYRKYEIPDNKKYIGENTRFRQQLMSEAYGCGNSLQMFIEKSAYQENEIENAVIRINECRGYIVDQQMVKQNIPRKYETGALVSGYINKEKYSWYISDWGRINYGVGLYYESFSKRKPKRNSIYNEIIYKHVTQPGIAYDMTQPDIVTNRIKLIHALRYSFPGKKSGRFFWDFGANYGWRFNTSIGDRSEDVWGDFGKAQFEAGLNSSVGKTFAISEKFNVTAALRYEFVSEMFGTWTFVGSHQLGLNLCFSLLKRP